MRSRDWAADDRGFSTVLGAVVICVLAALLVGVLYVCAAVDARHHAQTAADLAALAGAYAHAAGTGDECKVAGRLVAEQTGDPRLDSCTVDGQDVVVRVAVPVRLGGLGVRHAAAASRAGPAEESG